MHHTVKVLTVTVTFLARIAKLRVLMVSDLWAAPALMVASSVV